MSSEWGKVWCPPRETVSVAVLKTSIIVFIREGTADWDQVAAAVAYRLARRQLPDRSSVFSPQKFTQPQLLACLILRERLGGTYRAMVNRIEDKPLLRRVLELHDVPHFTTLKHFEDRVTDPAELARLRSKANRLMIRTGRWLRRGIRIADPAAHIGSLRP